MASNVETTFRFLVGKGLSPAQAAGVVGGLSGESGKDLSTTALNPSSAAFGIGQWLGGRKAALLKRKNPNSLSTQLNFLWDELQGPESAAFKQVKGAKTIEDATKAWVLGFERPASNETTLGPRTQTARNVFNTYKGAGGASLPAQDGAAPPQGSSASTVQPDSTAGVQLLASLLQQGQPQAPQASPLQAPSFSAGPALPTGYQPASSSAGPTAPQASVVDSLLPLVSQIQGQEPAPTPSAPDPAASPDVADPNTGPGASFGKSHSPLFELIHKGDKDYAVKNSKRVGKGFYSAVWDGHANHVHVAAGPNTIVALGKLAQSMGLKVGENPYFTGAKPAGGVHAGHSYHYVYGKTKSGKVAGEAIDVSGDSAKMNVYAERVATLYGLG